MAISIIFGLPVSTVLTLIIIPCSYAIVEHWRQTLRSMAGLHKDVFFQQETMVPSSTEAPKS
jgi:hypothetical protein